MAKLYLGASFVAILSFSSAANAQQLPDIAVVVSSCGAQSYTAGQNSPVVQDTAGNVCINGSGGGGTSNVNLNQVGGTATAVGNGTTNAGTQRITISSDSTGQVAISQTTPGSTNGVNIAPSAASGVSITPVATQGASTLQGKGSAGNLYDVYLTATADSWLMVFNSTTAPTNGATTAGIASGNMVECIKVANGTTGSIQYPSIPERFSTGIYFAISSTACSTLTLATTGMIHGRVQ